MGCCFSATASKNDFPQNRRHHSPASDANGAAPPPLPPPLEEETVKEVLSETHIPNPSFRYQSTRMSPVVEEAKVEPTAEIKPSDEIVSEASEVFSEIRSFSESLSAATEIRDDDGEVTQRVRRSAPTVPRYRPVRSPARRSEPSPMKRTHVVSRSGQGRTMTTAEAARRNVGPSNAPRRAGDGSGRRSRSPVTRGEVGPRHRSPAVIPTGRPGGRPPAENGGKRDKPNGDVLTETEKTTTTESLENPLVSLECFIFL